MGTEIRMSIAMMTYGFTLKELADMYGLTYYQVFKMHAKDMLTEYMKWHKIEKK